jgi:hypothetical protein
VDAAADCAAAATIVLIEAYDGFRSSPGAVFSDTLTIFEAP